jgi:hypothetical protein
LGLLDPNPDPYFFSTDPGSGSGVFKLTDEKSRIRSQRYGSEDPHPDSYQIVTDLEHCLQVRQYVGNHLLIQRVNYVSSKYRWQRLITHCRQL